MKLPTHVVDLGKVQMFSITVAIVGAYGMALANAIEGRTLFSSAAEGSLPDLSDTFVALLGLSHAGYLAVKVPDKGPTVSYLESL